MDQPLIRPLEVQGAGKRPEEGALALMLRLILLALAVCICLLAVIVSRLPHNAPPAAQAPARGLPAAYRTHWPARRRR